MTAPPRLPKFEFTPSDPTRISRSANRLSGKDYELGDGVSPGLDYRTPEEEQQAQYIQQQQTQAPPASLDFGSVLGGIAGAELAGGFGGGTAAATAGANSAYTLPTSLTYGGEALFGGGAAGTGAGILGTLGPIAAAPLAAMTAQNTVSGVGKITRGEHLSGMEQAALALPTFGLSFAANPIMDFFGSGKDKDQQKRDAIRSNAQQQGFIDENYQLDLGNGRKYDLGLDGSVQDYNIDFSNPAASIGVQYFKPFATLLAGGDKKGTDDFTGILYNNLTNHGAITDPVEIRNQALRLAAHLGLSPSQFLQSLEQYRGGMGDDETNALISVVNSLRPGGKPLALPAQPQAQGTGNAPAQQGAQNAVPQQQTLPQKAPPIAPSTQPVTPMPKPNRQITPLGVTGVNQRVVP